MQVNPHLSFNGQCETAFKFYERCLGGKIEALIPHAGTPAEAHVPSEWGSKILHACLKVNGQILMGHDAPPSCYEPPKGFSVTIQVSDPSEAERVFAELSQDGAVRMPIQKTFWSPRFGMLVDRFGIPWMVNCTQAV